MARVRSATTRRSPCPPATDTEGQHDPHPSPAAAVVGHGVPGCRSLRNPEEADPRVRQAATGVDRPGQPGAGSDGLGDAVADARPAPRAVPALSAPIERPGRGGHDLPAGWLLRLRL